MQDELVADLQAAGLNADQEAKLAEITARLSQIASQHESDTIALCERLTESSIVSYFELNSSQANCLLQAYTTTLEGLSYLEIDLNNL